MKRILLSLSLILVLIVAAQNRAAMLYPFVHAGMTEEDVSSLLGKNYHQGWTVAGMYRQHRDLTYQYHILWHSFGNLQIRLQGTDPMKTGEA